MRAPLAACREPVGKLWQLCKMSYVFEHKTQNILIHASYTRIVVFWHISEILLYNRQLVVIIRELIYGVRAAHC